VPWSRIFLDNGHNKTVEETQETARVRPVRKTQRGHHGAAVSSLPTRETLEAPVVHQVSPLLRGGAHSIAVAVSMARRARYMERMRSHEHG